MTRYAICRQCGWRYDTPLEGDDYVGCANALAAHIKECPSAVGTMVPMWSTAWPWYWSEASVAHRERGGPAPDFGLEAAWRPVGSHSTTVRSIEIGSDMKIWYLFP